MSQALAECPCKLALAKGEERGGVRDLCKRGRQNTNLLPFALMLTPSRSNSSTRHVSYAVGL